MANENQQSANEASTMNADDFEASFGTTSLQKSVLTFDEVHRLNVNKVSYGEGEYGEWVSLSTDTDLYFFASYEMQAITNAIGDNEGGIVLDVLRRKVEGKNGRTYNKAFARLVEISGGAE